MTTWRNAEEPPLPPISAMGWLRVVLRGGVLAVVVFGCLVILLLVRLVERPIWGMRRPITPYITQFVCRAAFLILGMGHRVRGVPLEGRGAQVSNHSSWLDIFALNARDRIYFVSKAEVAGWPGIGWLARATGTVFIARDPAQARIQRQMFEDRLHGGHRLMFFPEGTSTDGKQVVPFKSTLFAAFFTDALREELSIQPVSVRYTSPVGAGDSYYGWWGDMSFGPHLLKVLASSRQGAVHVIYHPPLKVSDFPDRKALARACEEQVRAGIEE